jgi:TolB-like protein/tetratricopeptide (TPR) repeat protein
MAESAPREGASAGHRVVKFAANAYGRLWARLKRFGRPIAAIAAFGAVLSGLLGYWSAYKAVEKVVAPTSAGTAAYRPGPPLMSVAVMPFTTTSTSADDELFAERLTQDVTAGIERARRSVVVSHGLVVAKYKGKVTDPRTVGRDLNVRYLFEGDLSRQKEMDVVMARLIETATGSTAWSSRLAAPTSIGEFDNRALVAQLSNRFRVVLYDAEEKRVGRLSMAGAGAEEIVLHADRLTDQDLTPKAIQAARKLYEEALRKDPNSVEAVLGLLWVRYYLVQLEAEPPEETVRQLNDLSTRAISLDRDDPRVWEARSDVLLLQGQWQGALDASAEELRIDPYLNRAVGKQGYVLLMTGRPEEALPVLDRAIALDPRSADVGWFLQYQCSAHLNLGQYDEAVAACERGLALDENWFKYLSLLAALAQKGDMARAKVVKVQLLKLKPDISIAQLKEGRIWANPLYQRQREANLYAGLRKMGIPEQ